jgi:hypothetical protein
VVLGGTCSAGSSRGSAARAAVKLRRCEKNRRTDQNPGPASRGFAVRRAVKLRRCEKIGAPINPRDQPPAASPSAVR